MTPPFFGGVGGRGGGRVACCSQEENHHPRSPVLIAWLVPQVVPRVACRKAWWPSVVETPSAFRGKKGWCGTCAHSRPLCD